MIWAILLRACASPQDPDWAKAARIFRDFSIASAFQPITFPGSTEKYHRINVNSEYCKQALTKVGNPNVLINLISRRVRQLNSAGGIGSRPLLNEVAGLGAADIALKELIEEKMGWENPADLQLEQPAPKKRKRG